MSYQSQFERLELKYLLDEATARRIARHIEPYCVADEHNEKCGKGYFISSLYFDSPNLALWRAKARSDHDRIKLRARVYEVGGDVSLEIKRKRGDVVWKRRGLVEQRDFAAACRGFHDRRSVAPRHQDAVDEFAALLALHRCEPALTVEYEREAYASRTGEYARVTFDRNISAYPTESYRLMDGMTRRRAVRTGKTVFDSAAIVLELKCESRMPAWMADLILSHELSRIGFSKYGQAMVDHVHGFMVRDALLREVCHG